MSELIRRRILPFPFQQTFLQMELSLIRQNTPTPHQIFIKINQNRIYIDRSYIYRVPLCSTPPKFSTSVPHKRNTLFQPQNPPVQHTPQFHTKNLSVPHRKPLGSTPKNPSVPHAPQFHSKTPQFHTKNLAVPLPQFRTTNPSVQHITQFYTKNPSVQHIPQLVLSVELRSVWNLGVYVVELRGFWCWTEGYS